MSAAPRSLTDSLRQMGDSRLVELLRARPDLTDPSPTSLIALATRATSAHSVERALEDVNEAELSVVGALARLPDACRIDTVAAELTTEASVLEPILERLRTLALLWGDQRLHLVRQVREIVLPRDPDAALPLPADFRPSPPLLTGMALQSAVTDARTAQAVEAAFEAVRVFDSLSIFAEQPPPVLRSGGFPQRSLRSFAASTQSALPLAATVLSAAWHAKTLAHDFTAWHPTAEFELLQRRPPEQRWAAIVLAWALSESTTVLDARTDPVRIAPLLTEHAGRAGVRTQRFSYLQALAHDPQVAASETSMLDVLRWTQPLAEPGQLHADLTSHAVEAAVLGLVVDGAITELGRALVAAVNDGPCSWGDAMGESSAGSTLANALEDAAPEAVSTAFIDADGTIVIPGRPDRTLVEMLEWTDVVSRGAGVTARLTATSLARQIEHGGDPERLRELLDQASPTPLPQPVVYELERATATPAPARKQGARYPSQSSRPRPPTLIYAPTEPAARPWTSAQLHELVQSLRAADASPSSGSLTDQIRHAIELGSAITVQIADERGRMQTRRLFPLSLTHGVVRAMTTPDSEHEVVVFLVHRATVAPRAAGDDS